MRTPPPSLLSLVWNLVYEEKNDEVKIRKLTVKSKWYRYIIPSPTDWDVSNLQNSWSGFFSYLSRFFWLNESLPPPYTHTLSITMLFAWTRHNSVLMHDRKNICAHALTVVLYNIIYMHFLFAHLCKKNIAWLKSMCSQLYTKQIRDIVVFVFHL